jgi:hypothetical protein
MKPFKNRKFLRDEPVEVYRNLNRGGYSIRQRGLVVGHADYVTLLDATFVVRESGRKRALREGVRNVHAWVSGAMLPRTRKVACTSMIEVSYRPKEVPWFFRADHKPNLYPRVKNARIVVLTKSGVVAWRTNDW